MGRELPAATGRTRPRADIDHVPFLDFHLARKKIGNAMKKQILQWIVVATVGFSSFIGPLQAEDFKPVFGNEYETHRPLPPNALSAVRAHAKTTQYRDCAAGKFVGSAVDLTGR